MRTRKTLILTVLCAGMFLVLLDVTVVNVAIPSIGTSLHGSTAGVQWVVDGYAVALASLLLGAGAAGDLIGHRRLVLAGLVVFGLASIGCASAPDAAMLIGARVAQGAGAALLLPGSIALLTDTYPQPGPQARALGIWAGVSSLALPAGPLLGGVLVSTVGWRWVFWLNPPIVLAALFGVLILVPATARTPGRRLDLAGIVLAALSLAAVVYAVIAAGRGGALSTVVISAGCAVLGGIGFVWRERHAVAPVLPLELFRDKAFRGANLVAGTMNLATNGSLFVLTLYLQSVLGYPAIAAGALLLPMFLPLAGLAPLAGRLTARYGSRRPMLFGAVCAGLGELGLTMAGPHRDYLLLVPGLLGIGLGAGLVTAPVVAAAVRAVPAEKAGLASGVNNTARQVGTALGVAVFGSIAGSPARPERFVAGLHWLGLGSAALWLAALVLTALSVPAQARRPASTSAQTAAKAGTDHSAA